jgi:hypothetical protein
MELHAFYVYTSMSFYFDRDDVALPGTLGQNVLKIGINLDSV